MISAAPTVDAFLKTLAPDEQAVFAQLRKWLRSDQAVAESMEYRMPTYKIGAAMVGAFNKQKQYLCLYVNPAAADRHRAALKAAKLDCGKSCIRFKKPGQLPLDLAEQMIKRAIKLAKG
jgi:uncharacterized protein YdhG (YjbR/CyaY superfamily)